MPFKLLAWGANTYGQLGLGLKSESCLSPKEVVSDDPALAMRDVISIVGGGGHTLIMDSKGELFSCGRNSKGQLGRKECEGKNDADPKLGLVSLEEEDRAIQIACGWDSSYCITWGYKLLVWGRNTDGQLGIPKNEHPTIVKPMKVPRLGDLKQVAAGQRHALVLTKDGHVLACGNGSKGQLGILDHTRAPLKELEHFREVPELSDIVQIACGLHFSAALDNKGRIWVWGDNHHGQLGIDPASLKNIHVPQCLNISSTFDPALTANKVVKIYCGWTHMAARTSSRALIIWGRNNYGQLGCHESMRPEPWKPQLIDKLEGVRRMAVGAEHNVVLTESGSILSWGWNEHGNCGTGDDKNVLMPSQITIAQPGKVIAVGAGSGHSFALVEEPYNDS
ncbi:secretion-regulating guanine nucleotide exchange factor [Hetaerina americana]|uniref:secretion-regulating guanine nucleotide exchange factor n=1 Tax=Hetaerina americana TaxID=62018 RepID=UPI003A7F34CC